MTSRLKFDCLCLNKGDSQRVEVEKKDVAFEVSCNVADFGMRDLEAGWEAYCTDFEPDYGSALNYTDLYLPPNYNLGN